jgi:hydrogenase nickel incorporation protein HypA/HybF
VGALRQVVPESLTFCWNIVRDHTDLFDTELELELVPAEVRCKACGRTSEIASKWSLYCPLCASADIEVLRGEEFLVTSLDVSDARTKAKDPAGLEHG